VVCTLPVASAIKKQWPESEVVWVVDKRFRGIADCCTNIDQVVERPKRPQDIRLLGEFDAALDMQGLFKSGILVACARAKQKLGYHWQREGSFLFSRRVMPDPSSIHVVDQYVDVARALGTQCHGAEFGLVPKAEDLDTVREKLTKRGWNGGRLVLCNAGAGWATKRWSAEKFAKLADQLTVEDIPVGFLGAPSDRTVMEEIRGHGATQVMDMIGETNVRELVALVSLVSVHIGGDTGSTHIAGALGVNAIGIYPMTRPERSCPYGQIGNCFVGDPTVEEVLEKTFKCLKEPALC